jgi:hypothetical protein
MIVRILGTGSKSKLAKAGTAAYIAREKGVSRVRLYGGLRSEQDAEELGWAIAGRGERGLVHIVLSPSREEAMRLSDDDILDLMEDLIARLDVPDHRSMASTHVDSAHRHAHRIVELESPEGAIERAAHWQPIARAWAREWEKKLGSRETAPWGSLISKGARDSESWREEPSFMRWFASAGKRLAESRNAAAFAAGLDALGVRLVAVNRGYLFETELDGKAIRIRASRTACRPNPEWVDEILARQGRAADARRSAYDWFIHQWRVERIARDALYREFISAKADWTRSGAPRVRAIRAKLSNELVAFDRMTKEVNQGLIGDAQHALWNALRDDLRRDLKRRHHETREQLISERPPVFFRRYLTWRLGRFLPDSGGEDPRTHGGNCLIPLTGDTTLPDISRPANHPFTLDAHAPVEDPNFQVWLAGYRQALAGSNTAQADEQSRASQLLISSQWGALVVLTPEQKPVVVHAVTGLPIGDAKELGMEGASLAALQQLAAASAPAKAPAPPVQVEPTTELETILGEVGPATPQGRSRDADEDVADLAAIAARLAREEAELGPADDNSHGLGGEIVVDEQIDEALLMADIEAWQNGERVEAGPDVPIQGQQEQQSAVPAQGSASEDNADVAVGSIGGPGVNGRAASSENLWAARRKVVARVRDQALEPETDEKGKVVRQKTQLEKDVAWLTYARDLARADLSGWVEHTALNRPDEHICREAYRTPAQVARTNSVLRAMSEMETHAIDKSRIAVFMGSSNLPAFYFENDRYQFTSLTGSNQIALAAALQASADRWGSVSITGNKQFVKASLQAAAKLGITVSNPELQEEYRKLRAEIAKEDAKLAEPKLANGEAVPQDLEWAHRVVGNSHTPIEVVDLRDEGARDLAGRIVAARVIEEGAARELIVQTKNRTDVVVRASAEQMADLEESQGLDRPYRHLIEVKHADKAVTITGKPIEVDTSLNLWRKTNITALRAQDNQLTPLDALAVKRQIEKAAGQREQLPEPKQGRVRSH